MSEYVFRTDEPIEDCEECPIATVTNFITWCSLKKCVINKGCSFSCPLAELPEHGRLIDADKLYDEALQFDFPNIKNDSLWVEVGDINNAPTILEASK